MARSILGAPNEIHPRIGSVTLQPHQVDGVRRLEQVLARHDGALLADEVGLGKTYTALAAARRFERVLIVAPAALRAMWHEACARCEVAADFVSAESLSRSAPLAESDADLVLVDEAHWFRNPATRRYRRLARRCRSATVLLLSATPLHNRPADLDALFALFLGSRAKRLTPHDAAQLTVRRGRDDASRGESRPPPRVRATEWWRVGADPRVVAALTAIAPPVPLRDGELAMGLLRLTLLRRLSSSHAALRATLRRMLARSLALLQAAQSGRYPSARELRAWLVADDVIQLAFPAFVVPSCADPNDPVSRGAIERHIASIRTALAALDGVRDRDQDRASALLRLMRQFPHARIVAFSQYDTTVRALARALCREPGIAALSARAGRIASGSISRDEVLRQFDAGKSRAAAIHRAMRIRLLLTTDLLSEGVNLHNAEVVVHLDVPWTPARLEQRVGRLSRIGSPHEAIYVFGFAPPDALERMYRTVARLRAKWTAARLRFGASPLLARDALLTPRRSLGGQPAAALALDQEALLRMLTLWLGAAPTYDATSDGQPIVACVRRVSGQPTSVLALLGVPCGALLVACEGSGAISTHPRLVFRVAQRFAHAPATTPDWAAVSRTIAKLERYLARLRGEAAATTASVGGVSAFQAQVARAVARLPRCTRPRALGLAAAIGTALQEARSAGDHALLAERCAELVGTAVDTEPLRWLERSEADLAKWFATRPSGPRRALSAAWRIDAILIGT